MQSGNTVRGLIRQLNAGMRGRFALFACATAVFWVVVSLPVPGSLLELVRETRPLGYDLSGGCETIQANVSKLLGKSLSAEEVAAKAKTMVAILFFAAFLWGTEAIPIGATDLLVGSLMYLFFILPFDSISKAYMKDAVFFILGVLALAVGVSKTGLDRRIASLLLRRVRGLKSLCFVFFPLLAVCAGFFSEHALIAILVPVLCIMYRGACDMAGVKEDRPLALLLILGTNFALNQGGPGSPAAGGRNSVMVGYFKDFGAPISFGQWVVYSVPYVVVVSLVIGAFMYFTFKKRIKASVDFGRLTEQTLKHQGKMSGQEVLMSVIFLLVVVLWVTSSKRFGLGGPSIFGLVLMLVFGLITWHDVQARVRFDVVGLYAAACAMGVGIKTTGGALWLARCCMNMLPDAFQRGDPLLIAVSGFTAILTNFMSDGATVAAIGPVALSMAAVSGVHIWKVGLACSFASSFANALIVGTPNNAISYVGALDPKTGQRLVRLKDFLVYGIPVTFLAWVVLWGWAILGYWRWMKWE
ncbi:MAG: anion permease [Kiritimatiellae bacterium]|nr:anion permease [Kiritimatiellia bacterium]